MQLIILLILKQAKPIAELVRVCVWGGGRTQGACKSKAGTNQTENKRAILFYQHFIVYFHIQKDKIEIILSSTFFFSSVRVQLLHTGQILHSYWFILAPMKSRNNHIPTSKQNQSKLWIRSSKITTVKRNNDPLQN